MILLYPLDKMVNLKAVVFLPLVAALPTARSGPAGDITCYYREDTMAKVSYRIKADAHLFARPFKS